MENELRELDPEVYDLARKLFYDLDVLERECSSWGEYRERATLKIGIALVSAQITQIDQSMRHLILEPKEDTANDMAKRSHQQARARPVGNRSRASHNKIRGRSRSIQASPPRKPAP